MRVGVEAEVFLPEHAAAGRAVGCDGATVSKVAIYGSEEDVTVEKRGGTHGRMRHTPELLAIERLEGDQWAVDNQDEHAIAAHCRRERAGAQAGVLPAHAAVRRIDRVQCAGATIPSGEIHTDRCGGSGGGCGRRRWWRGRR